MTDLDTKLLPCPHCGCTDAFINDNGDEERVECGWCGATSGFDPDPEFEGKPISWHWNRRVSPSQGEGPAADVVEAAKAVIADWDHRLPDGPESFKTNDELGFSYWSPAASMVSSEPMSRLRAALASLAPRAAQEATADEQSGETSHVADDGQPDEAQEWHDYDPDC